MKDLQVYVAITANSKKYLDGFECSSCGDWSKIIRHCPFVKNWQGDIKYIINCSTGQVVLDECPMGFVKINSHLKYFLDCYYATEKGLPLWHGVGFMEYPNLIIQGMEVVAEELNYQRELVLEKVKEK